MKPLPTNILALNHETNHFNTSNSTEWRNSCSFGPICGSKIRHWNSAGFHHPTFIETQ